MSVHSSKSHVFEKEVDLLNRSEKIVSDIGKLQNKQLIEEYTTLTKSYGQLLEETRLITRVSDRLQNKINRANDKLSVQAEEISKINTALENNNKVLKNTIDELVKAKISKRAGSIALIFALVLFLISEALLEPMIEERVEGMWTGLLFKAMIFALLKPIEMLVEKYLERKTAGREKIAGDVLG